jgi:hypothetical protein
MDQVRGLARSQVTDMFRGDVHVGLFGMKACRIQVDVKGGAPPSGERAGL